ncbi:MAG TPA: branched-chain amino acid ABC transporter permease, partial [Nakamurella sp.]
MTDLAQKLTDRTARATGSSGTGRSGWSRWLPVLVPLAVLALLVFLPWMRFPVPGVLPGVVNSPGSMQLLALCLVTAGIALSYDVLFGRTGLLSFGHALFVGAGAYAAAIALGKWGASLGLAVLVVLACAIVLPLVVGAIALRVKGIAFAMVTLAFAQAVAITASRNPGGLTGGEEGLSLNRSALPAFLSGVVNAPYRYWLALGFLVVCVLVVLWLTTARTGHAWAAVRENEDRVEVLGMSAYRTKLTAVVVAGFLGTLGGFIQLIIIGGANPHLLSTELTLSLLIMVVLGGAGSRWGAVIGGVVYVLLDNRLQELSTSSTIAELPAVLRVPLSQPVFVLGLLFVLVVYFAPGGLTAVGGRVKRWVAGRR